MAQQGGERLIRAGQRVQAHHLRGGTGRRSHHPELHLLLRRLYLGGGDLIQADITRRAGTSTIPDLNHGEFYKIKVFEPPIDLQKEFDEFKMQVDKSKLMFQKLHQKLNILQKKVGDI